MGRMMGLFSLPRQLDRSSASGPRFAHDGWVFPPISGGVSPLAPFPAITANGSVTRRGALLELASVPASVAIRRFWWHCV
jgi:hypothetical protein